MQKNFKNFSDVRAICPFYLGLDAEGHALQDGVIGLVGEGHVLEGHG